MANPDGAKPRKEEANMAMTLASVGVRNDQDYSSDAEGHNVEESALIAAKNAKKKSCFQITSVKASDNPHNDDNDSIDDMDESRAEDFSSSELLDVSKASTQTDLDRLDLEEKAHSTPKKVTTNNVPLTNNTSIVNANQTVLNSNGNRGRRTGSEPPHELKHQHSASSQQHPTNGNQHGNGNPSRFIVVKVPRLEPFTRGRWTCRDFETQPSSQSGDINRTEQQQQQNKDLPSGDSSAASSVHYEYVPGENPNADNPNLGESSTTGASITSEQTGSINSNTGIRLKSHTSKGNISGEDQQGLLEHNIKETLNMDASSGAPSTDDISEEGDGIRQDLDHPHRVALQNPCRHVRLQSRRTSAGGAIDNKIEQAMDLVKSHLLFAVREEVEVLKVKIQELSEKNEQLQRENALLRQSPGQTLPPPAQQTLPPNAQPQGTPLAIPQQTLHQQQQPAAHPQGMPQQQTKPQVFAAAAAAVAAAQGQTLPPPQGQTLPPQGQLQALPMAIPQQTLPPQQAAPHTQGIPQQQAAAQHPPTQEQYTHLQQQQQPPQAIPMQQQQQHSIPGTQQAGVLQQPQLAVAPQQPVQHNQQQPPKT